MSPPPFYCKSYQDGYETKKKGNQKKSSKKGRRSASRKKQSIQKRSSSKHPSISFIDKPLSNFDLFNWVEKLGIKYFRGIYSRDALPPKILKNEVGIINLDSKIGPGTHWVAYRNGEKGAEYFDSFGLIMPNEVMKYLITSGKNCFIQEMRSKKEIVFYVDVGVYTIYWRDKKVFLC